MTEKRKQRLLHFETVTLWDGPFPLLCWEVRSRNVTVPEAQSQDLCGVSLEARCPSFRAYSRTPSMPNRPRCERSVAVPYLYAHLADVARTGAMTHYSFRVDRTPVSWVWLHRRTRSE